MSIENPLCEHVLQSLLRQLLPAAGRPGCRGGRPIEPIDQNLAENSMNQTASNLNVEFNGFISICIFID